MNDNFGLLGRAANLPLKACSSWGKLPLGAVSVADRTLQLDSLGTSGLYTSNSKTTKRKWDGINGVDSLENASLTLGLGYSQSSSDNSKMSSTTVCTMSSAKDTTDEESSVDLGLSFELHLGSVNALIPKKPLVNTIKALKTGPNLDLELSLFTGRSKPDIPITTLVSDQHQNISEASVMTSQVSIIGEEQSSSPQWKFDSRLVPSLYHSETTSISPLKQKILAKADTPVSCISEVTHQQQRNGSTKSCQFAGCRKGARGASGLCIAHGGGRRCQKAGCHKGAEGRTVYCKAHGGGRRCQYLGCTKSAEGRTDHCITHGGGRRCSHEGCTRAARGKSSLCIRHGGGKRCQRENCTKSAEGYSGLCISHGGGRRCQFPACTKGAQGSTVFCKAHGGGKRCTVLGCTKGAEGSTSFCKGHGGGKRCSFEGGVVCTKSVHGGTQFCVSHGGGKRCAVPDCTKSARGRTDFCVRHGGGKRCKSEGCGKSAQGSTDFCKAHGGGKRYSWVQRGLVQDHCVHGDGTLVPAINQFPAPIKCEMVRVAAAEGDYFLKIENDGMGSTDWSIDAMKSMHPVTPFQSESVSAPEGRVHGGCLMAMLSGSVGVENHSWRQAESGPTDYMIAHNTMVHGWM